MSANTNTNTNASNANYLGEIGVSCCNLLVSRYSTRVTCYECSECGRNEQDRS